MTATDEVVGTVTTTVPITREFVDDLLATAFEVGSNHWIEDVKWHEGAAPGARFVSEVPARGGTLTIVLDEELEEGKGRAYPLNLEGVLRGLRLYAEQARRSIGELVEDHDADDADNVLQLALFGEVVFG